jgi:regulator of protease activity HflC (stomatin/prohibitin superfamily)
MERQIPLDDFRKSFKPAFIIAAIVLLFIVFRPFVIIPAGHRGVVFNNFKGIDKSRVLGEGMHFLIPFVESSQAVDVRVQKQDFAATAASMDLQEVKATVALNYHLDPAKVADIYQDVGSSYQATLILPSVQESIKAITARYNATSLISERPEVKDRVHESLIDRLAKFHIIVVDVSITDLQFSDEFTKAIEAKQIAEQEAFKKRYELEKAKQEASIEIARAEGDKKATIARAEGQAEAQKLLRVSVSPEIIKLKEIEAQMEAIKKWDGKMPSVTGGSIPMFDIGSSLK